MERTLRIINCPCCASVLYALRLDEAGEAKTWRLSKDSPALRKDAQGAYMNCARCARRIGLAMADELESPGFRVADEQPCS